MCREDRRYRPSRRNGAACLAHARRKRFNALTYAREAQTALDLIRDVYVVEHDARFPGWCGRRGTCGSGKSAQVP